MEKTPAQIRLVEQARAWALSPAGREQIGLDGPDPMTACMRFYRDKMPAHYVGGWCHDLVKEATGKEPGSHGHHD